MRYVVTGGCGFIGSHLVAKLLRAGADVRVVDNLSTSTQEALPAGAELWVEDILAPNIMRHALQGADGCFHLAALSSVERHPTECARATQVNVTGTAVVLDAAKSAALAPVPVVYASSAAVYGVHLQSVEETAHPQPISAYGRDKLACESYGKMAWGNGAVPNIGLRFFNVYGPGQKAISPYSGVISRFLHAAVHSGEVTVFGNGAQTRDFVFIEDAVSALTAAMALPEKPAEIFNVCSGQPTRINDLIAMIGEHVGRSLRVHYTHARAGDISHSLGVPEKLLKAAALPLHTPLSVGLKRTMADVADTALAAA